MTASLTPEQIEKLYLKIEKRLVAEALKRVETVKASHTGPAAKPLDRVLYGADKSIDFGSFNFGDIMDAIAQDLEEFGEKGVQGVRVPNDGTKFIAEQQARKDLKYPYLQAGVLQGHLVLAIFDAADRSVRDQTVLLKDYTALKERLASSSVSITNIDTTGDDVIVGSAQALANRHGVGVDPDPDFGDITGDIILDAHGTPDVLPGGKVIGTLLGERTPQQIVDMLTTSKDKKKRISKNYNGTLTLCGCFTASGGPEANKQDDVFAKKVLDLLRERGYKKISVRGYPGPMAIERADAGPNEGRAFSWANVRTGDDVEKFMASMDFPKRQAALQQLYDKIIADLQTRSEWYAQYQAALKKSKLTEVKFIKTPTGKGMADALNSFDKDIATLRVQYEAALAELNRHRQEYAASGLGQTFARLEGRFGLRTVN
jgi:hypothetical protein